VVCAALLVGGVFAANARAAAPLVVRPAFDASSVQFAGVIHVRVVVLLDVTLVRPDSLRMVDDFAPLTSLSPGMTTTTRQGATITIALTRTFSCVSSSCVSASGDATPVLRPVKATVLTLAGRRLRATASWPTLHVKGRVAKSDLARSRPPFRSNTTPAPPSYRLAPSTLAWLLYGAAAVLALAAGTLAVYEARRRAHRRHSEPIFSELERALRLAREAENRPPPDRRRALGLLARLLDARNRRLSGTASELAWAKPEPEQAALATFVADVEREVPS
jgi:hypothetical protein